MRLDRNINPDGRGKYALINLRKSLLDVVQLPLTNHVEGALLFAFKPVVDTLEGIQCLRLRQQVFAMPQVVAPFVAAAVRHQAGYRVQSVDAGLLDEEPERGVIERPVRRAARFCEAGKSVVRKSVLWQVSDVGEVIPVKDHALVLDPDFDSEIEWLWFWHVYG